MTAPIGAFTFMLHSHLPYARQAGMWPHGEEWVHEAIAETYVPLLNALYDLRDEGVPFRLTIGITPILGEQLADPLIVEHFIAYAAERAAKAAQDMDRFERAGDETFRDLARFYHHWYARVLTSFQDRFSTDLLGAFRTLQDEGLVEIATSAATHGYLPLLSRDSSIHGQLHTGVETYRRRFGRSPQAVWLPECAYRPAIIEEEGGRTIRRPGLESFVAEEGLLVFFSETHTVEGGRPVGMAVPGTIGPYGMIARRYASTITPPEPDQQLAPGTSLRPYWVGDAPGQVAVLARHERTGQQVWSATWVPRRLRLPRVSSQRRRIRYAVLAGIRRGRRPWQKGSRTIRSAAADQVRSHADHYAHLVEEQLREFHEQSRRFRLHHGVVRHRAFRPLVVRGRRLVESCPARSGCAASGRAQHGEPGRRRAPAARSAVAARIELGSRGRAFHLAERRYGVDVATDPCRGATNGRSRHALPGLGWHPSGCAQSGSTRALLLQSSDWPFLVTTLQAKQYAVERFQEHLERFDQLASLAQADSYSAADETYLAGLHERDNPFSTIDYRDWTPRQGYAGVPPVPAA